MLVKITTNTLASAKSFNACGYPSVPGKFKFDAFAPIAAFLLGVTDVTVPWQTLVLSTVLYVVLPLLAGMATRHGLEKRSPHALADFVARLKPWSIVGLIATVVLLFGFQAGTIVAKPGVILLIAIPLTLQTYGIFAISYLAARWLKLPHNVGGPACLIGTCTLQMSTPPAGTA